MATRIFYVIKAWPTTETVSYRTRNTFHRSSGRCARQHWTPRLHAGRECCSDKPRLKYRAREAARLCIAQATSRHLSSPGDNVHLVFSHATLPPGTRFPQPSRVVVVAELRSSSARPSHNKGRDMRPRCTDYLSTAARIEWESTSSNWSDNPLQ